MKWFDRWFYRKARWCWQRAGYEHPDLVIEQDYLDKAYEERQESKPQRYQQAFDASISSISIKTSDTGEDYHDLHDGLRIDVKKLNGGYVVTFRHTNRPDKHGNYIEPTKSSHIITDEQDFYDTITKLMTMELIRN
jgi:hypothetical protein